jgi:hypothetical protein
MKALKSSIRAFIPETNRRHGRGYLGAGQGNPGQHAENEVFVKLSYST